MTLVKAVKAGVRLGALVVAMLATIGAWEVYKTTVKARGDAYAQDTDLPRLITDIHQAVFDAGDGLGPRLHFKCYGITPGGQSLNQPVILFDQFFPPERLPDGTIGGGEQLTVRARHHLCTPTLKRIPTEAELQKDHGKK